MTPASIAVLALVLLAGVPAAAEESGGGQVQIPLDVYQQLIEASKRPRSAPSGYAFGRAEVELRVTESEGRASADVRVTLPIEVLEDEWVLVPVLPPGTAVGEVQVGGKPVQLIPSAQGLAWAVKRSGTHTMQLRYAADATRSAAGFVLTLPLPEAAATRFTARLPGAGLDVAVIPAAGIETSSAADTTTVSATVPATRGVQLSWRAPSPVSHAVSRAEYRGELVGDAIRWTGVLDVTLATEAGVTLELLPRHVTLGDVQVDGRQAAIRIEDEHFVAPIAGRGAHRVTLVFEVPVQRGSGPPRVALGIPEIPVSSFELRLPGRKELAVEPAATVTHRRDAEGTTAAFHVPVTRRLTLAWTEAVPEDLETETRSHASLYHAAHAEEGVLYLMALADFEVTRGEVSAIDFELPAAVQVNRIESENGGISDWRVVRGEPGEPQRVTVFLDHGLTGTLRFRVHYDRSLGAAEDPERPVAIPLVTVRDVHRQRGMVALLATKELALEPVAEQGVTRVGENQLPVFFREGLELSVAHTFKYVEARPTLSVVTATPERVQGKFDAEVDTLISLTDVTLKGSASVNLQVKSGSLASLQLTLPADVNLLGLTAPSLRSHDVATDAGRQRVDVEFTQEMEGRFRLEVLYERITADAAERVAVPTLRVVGAEVEQGRIAVEALAAVEVQLAASEQLTSLDPSELPQQLILKTTNPILLAYKYVHVNPPYALALRITRHRVVEVQAAAIDRADYRTLFTRDGLAVTAARFQVRNSRQQFLRVRLPEGASVWSVSVNGKPEKPAIASGQETADGAPPEILIKVINSAQGFPVELVYATPVARMGRLGRVGARLPRPDMVVTRSHWDVYLPDSYHYGTPRTDMDALAPAERLSPAQLAAELAGFDRAAQAVQPTEPPRLEVPRAGVRFRFEKLYANQSEREAAFSLPYASRLGAGLGQLVALLGAALFWVGLGAGLRPGLRLSARQGAALAALGAALWGLPVLQLGMDPTPGLVLSIVLVLGAAAWIAREWRDARAAGAGLPLPAP